MNLQELLRLVGRSWLALLLCVALGTIGSLAITLAQRPSYQASAQLFVSVQEVSTVQDLSSATTFSQQVVKSYADAATTSLVLQPVIQALRLRTSVPQLADRVSASAGVDTVIITITATDPRPRTAARLANAISQSLTDAVPRLSPSTSGASSIKTTLLQAAAVPNRPSSPSPPLNLAIGLIAGALIGLTLVFTREGLNTRIRGATELHEVTDRPVLANIAYDRESRTQPLVMRHDPTSTNAEEFRALRAKLQFVTAREAGAVVAITSSVEGEGKTTVTANLAVALTDAGARVTVIDADLRRPRLADYFGLDSSLGLSDLLVGRVSMEAAAQLWGDDGRLRILAAGSVPPNPNELLQNESMRRLIHTLSGSNDIVLIDTPPVLPVADAASLSRLVDAYIMVGSVRGTKKSQLQTALSDLTQTEAAVFGVVLTMTDPRTEGAYAYSYRPQRPTPPLEDPSSGLSTGDAGTSATSAEHVPR